MKSSSAIIKSALDVLSIEISGVKLVKRTFDSNFVAAIKELSKTKGRVIITGIGKSGHIANKIASTMSSTGTAAQFCHSNEMSHGDLGILSSKDILIIISNSGNSSELKDAISFSKKNKIKTIGISSNIKSELMQSVHYPLLLPIAKEACAVGKAPTTSTTMTLVLGDAICVALMKLKKFKIEDYKKIHPGGALGLSLMKVKDIMHTKSKLPLVNENIKMKNVIIEMTKKSFGHVGVIDKDKKIVGVITDGDLRRGLNARFLDKQAKDIMTKNPKIIFDEMPLLDALSIMTKNKITCLFISNNKSTKKPIGIIHIHDCLRLIQN
ncbi:MAG: KpsF/GutQ family sugar-phosphate isomerase [Pelagibacterales bacterium]|nr:KpsF/GutQ family sugar-phosphate isomerase [Pelagibacterales bacterium]